MSLFSGQVLALGPLIVVNSDGNEAGNASDMHHEECKVLEIVDSRHMKRYGFQKLQEASRPNDWRGDSQQPTSQSSDGADEPPNSHVMGVRAGINSGQLDREALITGYGEIPPVNVQWSYIR
ncbi:hypothetical protein MMC07_008499 [Pseudocyphellaria aurata]|nr:hypothetical protein [Pseudocyphellaria aurata]